MSVSGKNRHLIRTCVERSFEWDGSSYRWRHAKYRFLIVVEPTQTGTGSDIVRVTFTDLTTNNVVDDWSHDVLCGEGDWRDRLQALVGKLLIKAQHRPFCPRCRLPLLVKTTREGGRQFFGCRNYNGGTGCGYTRDLSAAFDPEDTPPRHTSRPHTARAAAAVPPPGAAADTCTTRTGSTRPS